MDPGIQTFADELRSPDLPVIAPNRFPAALRLRQQELAQLAHVHWTTVSEAPTNAKLQAAFMRDALRVLSAAMAVTGDRGRAIYWYRNTPIHEFWHQTAEHLVSAGSRHYIPSVDPVHVVAMTPIPVSSKGKAQTLLPMIYRCKAQVERGRKLHQSTELLCSEAISQPCRRTQ